MDLPPCLDTPEFVAKWAEWADYRKKRRLAKYATDRVLFMLARHGEAAAIKAIDHSIENNFQGLFPGKFTDEQPSRSARRMERGGRSVAPEGKYAALDNQGVIPVGRAPGTDGGSAS